MTLLTGWESLRELSAMQDRMNRMNRLFREPYSPEGPAEAFGVIKTLLADPRSVNPCDVLEREAAHQARLFDTDDFAEGIAAFREKRHPVFGERKGVRS